MEFHDDLYWIHFYEEDWRISSRKRYAGLKWCKDHLEHGTFGMSFWYNTKPIWFKNKEDAALFELTWL